MTKQDRDGFDTDDLMLAGIVGAARGLRGEMFVEPRTDRPEVVFSPGSSLVLADPNTGPAGPRSRGRATQAKPTGRVLMVGGARSHNGRFTVTFEDVVTREDAESLRGKHLLVAPEPEEDAWYAHELEGLRVVNQDGAELGTVSGLAMGAAHDFLLVNHAGREVMVPLVEEMVPTVSVGEGLIVVSPPVGLFDDEDAANDERGDA